MRPRLSKDCIIPTEAPCPSPAVFVTSDETLGRNREFPALNTQAKATSAATLGAARSSKKPNMEMAMPEIITLASPKLLTSLPISPA